MENTLTPVQSGWLKLAEIKTTLFEQLQAAELEVQGKLTGLPTTLPEMQAVIKDAKAIQADAKGKRLAFTRMLDEKLLTPSMEYEKRMEALITEASKKELELRKAEAARAEASQAYAREEAAYKAHIVNEWFRVAAEFRAKIEHEITTTYTYMLEHKIDPEHTAAYIGKLSDIIRDIQLPKPLSFKRVLISDAQAREIIKTIRPYDPEPDRKAAIDSLPKRFSTYQEDLANGQAALEAVQKEAAEKEQEQAQLLAAEVATNTLIAQSEIAVVEGPKIKRELRIADDGTEAQAKAIVANFVRYWAYCNKYVKVKSWSKLSIAQMGDALAKHASETGEQIQGLEFTEVIK